MKTLILLLFNALTLLASSWDPHTATSIESYRESSFHARFKTNEAQRFYSSVYSLLKDDERYGIKDIKAYTADTKQYIEADKAFFVTPLLQHVPFGVSTSMAFASKEAALVYAKAHKADVVDFQTLLHVRAQTMASDASFMQARFKKRAYPMGKKIYEKHCKDTIDPTDFMEISDLKEALIPKGVCGVLDDERLHALTLYLWDVKRKGDLGEIEGKIEVKEDEKCPVCGMFVYKYPKWAAQIDYAHEEHEHRFSFDGVKDMMKFYFNPLKWGKYTYALREHITKVQVSDYYSGRGIDGRRAFYVIRSDIYGPMGHEFIPFENEDEAKTFLREHRGKKVLRFEEITEMMAYELDMP